MANSGTIKSNKAFPGTTLWIYFYWNITNIDTVAGTATLNYKLYGYNSSAKTKYQVFGTDRNYFQLDGVKIWNVTDAGNGTKSRPYPMYTREDQDKQTTHYVSTSTGYTFNGYVKKFGILAKGSKTIQYDDDGNTSFTVYGVFQCLYGTGSDKRIYITSQTVTPDKIERYSKSKNTVNSGASWTGDKYVWKTTDYGATWSKCYLYKTTDSGSNWSKLT